MSCECKRESDLIILKDFEVVATHGVNAEEKINAQRFLFTVEMECSINEAGINDDLEKTVSYAIAKKMIKKFVEENCFNLIETLAVGISELLLKNLTLLTGVTVTVKKPDAPMSGKFDYVAVSIRRQWNEVYLSLGSNLDNREAYLDFAIKRLSECDKNKDIVESVRLHTEPYGGVADQEFVNSAVNLKTLMSPFELLEFINKIEKEANREREIHWGNRTLDVDILFYGDDVIQDNRLCVPHIDMQNRLFVLEPLSEIAPYKVHPLLGKRICEMLSDLKAKFII